MLTHPYSSFFILHSSFKKATVSAILHSSFFILHSSFFILHFTLSILHSSFKKATVSAALPADIPSPKLPFHSKHPRQNKEYQDRNVRFSVFYDIISRKMSKFASNSCII